METLLAKIRDYLPEEKISLVEDAYQFAERAHSGQLRRSGEPFIEHPIQTALLLADLKLDANALAAALLHDVLEDCDVCTEELEDRFGAEIAKLVDGVTKLTQAELLSEERSQLQRPQNRDRFAEAATIRKMIVAMAEDIRVVLIKLADRLHNMRTLKFLSSERQIAIAQETLDIYSPLAHRLGIWELKWRLEDLSFQYLNPTAYRELSNLLNSKRQEREEYVYRVQTALRAELDAAGIEAEVTGRPKHFYSIHKKIQKYAEQNKSFGEIYDLFALRVLVTEVKDCYSALGVVHSMWRPIPGQFDDYIASPKDNLYRALHTTVLCEDACPVEVQVRTHEFHNVAEYGVAAHWLYKEESFTDVQFEEKMTWLRQLLEWQRDVSGAEEFVESFKTDVFQNQVFVYTPKGDLKELPAGSTPLDFAYRIHTDVGNSCIGGKVNGKLVPLQYQLQNGDTVEILTSKTMRGPSLDWLNANLRYVNTTSARAKIRSWFNRQERAINIQRGKDIYQKQVRRLIVGTTDEEAVKLMKLDSLDDFFAELGNGGITPAQVVAKLSESTEQMEKLPRLEVQPSGPSSGVQVLGVGDLLTRMARCCSPILGDNITGYITRSRGVTVHRAACPNVALGDGNRTPGTR